MPCSALLALACLERSSCKREPFLCENIPTGHPLISTVSANARAICTAAKIFVCPHGLFGDACKGRARNKRCVLSFSNSIISSPASVRPPVMHFANLGAEGKRERGGKMYLSIVCELFNRNSRTCFCDVVPFAGVITSDCYRAISDKACGDTGRKSECLSKHEIGESLMNWA